MTPKLVSVAVLLALIVAPIVRAESDYIPSAELRQAGLVKFWQLRLPLEANQALADGYLVDDQLYLATQDGFVYAVHAHTGALRWMRRVTTGGYRLRRPCHAGDRTVFVTPSQVLQVDRWFGDPILRMDLRFPAGSAAASDGIRFYVGGIDRRLHAFDLDRDFDSWRVGTNGQIMSTPALYGKHLYVGSDDGAVYACVAANKSFYWQTSTGGSITADLAVDEKGVYAASRDQSLYLLDLQFGQPRWRARFSGPLYEAPVVTPDVAYQYCPDDGLVAVNTTVLGDRERFRWKLPRGRKLLTVDQRFAYVLSRDETLLVVELEDGRIEHTIPAVGFTMAMPSPEDQGIFVAAQDGRVFCARPRGVRSVRQEDLRRALGAQEAGPVVVAEVPRQAAQAGERRQDHLRSGRTGPPVGGKSKVTREYLRETRSNP